MALGARRREATRRDYVLYVIVKAQLTPPEQSPMIASGACIICNLNRYSMLYLATFTSIRPDLPVITLEHSKVKVDLGLLPTPWLAGPTCMWAMVRALG